MAPRANDEVDSIFLDESFFIAPNDDVADEAYSVIREAMRKTDMVGIARVVKRASWRRRVS